ncbi:uncharacterized protein LOC135847782 [Planococcus citri]|uniref:uncharacterized protein LOC135847782 n=1 Tax=Planococcus citri TaxID=170843 RepID=UPI0031F7FA32
MSSKEKKSRKLSDDEETKRSEHHKKQKTGEGAQDLTTKQPAPSCRSVTVDNEENATQNSTVEINASKTSTSSTELTLNEDLKSEPEETEEYKTARLKNLIRGIDYQLKLLIYFMQRGLEQYTFALATEMADAADFDDLVFRYREKNGEWVYRFLQAKHIRDNKKQITATDLLSEAKSKNNFGLKKYFECFRKIKTHPTFKNCKIGDFIIFTNIGLENIDYFMPVEENDEILTFEEGNAKLLKFDIEKFPAKEDLRSILGGSSHDVETEITDFFDKLVFAVDMPDEARLDEIIAKNMSREFNLMDSTLVTNDLYINILNWLRSKKRSFFKNQWGKKCFEKIKLSIGKLKVSGITYKYCEEIKQYGIEFNNIPSKLSNFLNHTDEQILILTSSCKTTRLSAIKVIQALKGMKKLCKADDSFISMHFSSVLKTRVLVENTFGSEETHNLLVVECADKKKLFKTPSKIEDNKKKLFKALSSVVEKRHEKKIIFITQENNPLIEEFKNNLTEKVKWSEETDENNSLTDLKQTSLEKLWKREIFEFQEGQKCVSLSTLLASEKSEYSLRKAIEGDLLFGLIKGSKNIKIGKAPKDSKYDHVKDYFINREFFRHEYIHKKIEQESKFYVIRQKQDNPPLTKDIIVISDTDEKFKQCCYKYAYNNIHWLKQAENNYVWQQSMGSISELHKFIDREVEDSKIRKTKLNSIMDVPDEVVLIAAAPGMGKSIIFSHLAINTQFTSSHLWILRCNLKDYSEELFKWKKESGVEEAIKFLYKITEFSCKKEIVEFDFLHVQNTEKVDLKCDKLKMMKLSSLCLFEIQLFTHFLNQRNIALLLDGFDEISPLYEEKLIRFIQVLKRHTQKIWMTTRPLEALTKAENLFNTFSYKLYPFTFTDSINFLTKFWKKELELVELVEQCSEAFIDKLLQIFLRSTDYSEKNFASFPLQIYMTAKMFLNLFKKIYQSKNQKLPLKDRNEFQKKLNFNTLYHYEDFIIEKFYEEQRKSNPGYDHTIYTVENSFRHENECIINF